MAKLYDIAPSATSEEAKLVDSAQIEILKYAKHAAEKLLDIQAYLKGVELIIKALTDRLVSESLIARCRAVLPPYAVRVYHRERELIKSYAMLYAYAYAAKTQKKRGGEQLYERTAESISPAVRGTPLFKTLIANIPDSAYNWAVPLEQWERSYTKTIKTIMEELIYSDPKEDYSSNVNLRNIAEMTVRYERQLDRLEELKTDGVKLVWIEPHANCSERCEKYQGRLYSLDNSSGKIDGIPYRPLSYATDNPQDLYVTKAGKTYQNGCITGFNCRHNLIPYHKGNKPAMIPADVIERRRNIEQRQRAMEREIRAQKRKAVLMRNISAEAYEEAREKASKMTEAYEEYSRSNNAAFSRDRTSIFTDELGRALYENLADQYIPH